MENQEVYEMMDEVIVDGLKGIKETTDAEEYVSRMKAVNGLVETRIREEEVQSNNYYKSVEADDRAKKMDDDNKLINRINPNTVITVGAMCIMTGVSLVAEANGWMVKPTACLSKLINMVSGK